MNKVLTALYKIAADMSIDWNKVPKTRLRKGFTPVPNIVGVPDIENIMKFVGKWESSRIGADGRHYPYKDKLTGTPTFLYGDTNPELINRYAYEGMDEASAQRMFAKRLMQYRGEFNRNFGRYIKDMPSDIAVSMNSLYYNMGYPRFNRAFGKALRNRDYKSIPRLIRDSAFYYAPVAGVPAALDKNIGRPSTNTTVTGRDGKSYRYNPKKDQWSVKTWSKGLSDRREEEATMFERGLAAMKQPKPEPVVVASR